MKTIKTLIALLLVIFIISCSKEEETSKVSFQEENPLPGILASQGVVLSQNSTIGGLDPNIYQFGFTFSSNVKGKINSVQIKTKVASNNLKFTIWDATTKVSLYQGTAILPVANQMVSTPITPFIIEKNRLYCISIQCSGDSIFYYTNGNILTPIAFVYPINIGNLTITSANFLQTSQQIYPESITPNRFYGDIDFKFQQIE